ncbi:MAG: carbamoyl-phosphate synthase (glutamine-hydrolyzing) large subunit [Calditrichaeota bacterium]|nr:carbamoyl-phosphate synthase (glutamine-hydrolyzing) large subunit [Calditrichota bacterium]HQU71170.1 carbamoyl-phosphate synthase (glutamine-hydrolyzing) large subunit [Calditrichia bacterium]
MQQMEKPKKVIILGSAALKIGEAGEFDYSGSQAIKAFKEEGIETVLINPNIATIQTSDHLADKVYFLPVNRHFVEEIIEKEQPDSIVLSFGGQTALNCGLELYHAGVLDKYNVKVLGSPVESVIDTEDRARFAERLAEIGAKTARSKAVTTVTDAVQVATSLGFPVIIRIAYALGGLGSGVCRNETEVEELATKSLAHAEQILVEEYLEGWKEVEYEVMRDRFDNCITVCNMENFDPMGIHTGESIVVAPSQTLSNREYHMLREVAIRVIRHLGIVGECNIQYALNPHEEDYRIIEVNARLSRSSALASKATGYPLAFIAAKLALGYGLHQLPNAVTRVTKAFFEPSLDYVVVKIPRWDLKKFRMVSRRLGSGMKSVGEVMAIGRKFEEALQKALRMLETGAQGLVANNFQFEDIDKELAEPTEERIFAIAKALENGYEIDHIHKLSHIDRWFLYKLDNIVNIRKTIVENPDLPRDVMLLAKQHGFSDKQLAILTKRNQNDIRALRQKEDIRPFIRQIDTLGAEYPAQTNYLYLSYNGVEDEISFPLEKSVLLLGSGSYRIGSSVEFDWCCVNAGMTLRDLGYQTVMLNYNPETVSTDYDEFDKLFFDEIRLETVIEIYDKLQPLGVIVSMGGQIPNNLALELHQTGVRILGTSPESIHNAEDRRLFSSLLDTLGVDQPVWKELTSMEEALTFANEVEFPVLVRPSYVLSGAAMAVASNDEELKRFLQRAADVSSEHPIVISKFLENAKEIEMDAVAKNGEIVCYAISEHVENAGVHSGDATLVVPPQRTYLETMRRIRTITRQIAMALNINGPFNIQFIAKGNAVKVIECNLRASRSFPFVSKILGRNFIEAATRVIMGETVEQEENPLFELNFVGVKAPQFSFTRLQGADPTLGVEMASTGEVGCIGDDFDEAFLKALISVGFKFPIKNVLLSTGRIVSKAELLESTRIMHKMGINFFATGGTADFMKHNGLPVVALRWPLEKSEPNTLTYIKEGKIDLVVNIPKNYQEEELTNDYMIRRAAVDFNVPLITNRQLVMRFVEAISRKTLQDLRITHWGEY